MRKMTFPLVLLSSMVFIAGCSSSSDGDTQGDSEEREINYLSNRTANQGQPRIVLPIMEQYQEENPVCLFMNRLN